MYGLGKNYNSGAFISIDNYIGIEDYRSIYFIYLLIKGFLFINYNHILPESETVTAENLNKLSLMKSRALWIEVASK